LGEPKVFGEVIMLELNKVFCGDCLELMKEIDDKSVNLAILDLPYNIKKDSWDRVENYEEWVGEVLLEIQRVLADNGSMYFFHNKMPVISKLMIWVENNSKFVFKNLITWNKAFIGSEMESFAVQKFSINTSRNYRSDFIEYILYYTFQDETGLKLIEKDISLYKNMREYCLELREFLGYSRQKMIDVIGNGSVQHFLEPLGPQWQLCTEETYNKLIEKFEIDKWKNFRPYEDLRNEYEDLRYTFNTLHNNGKFKDFNSANWLYNPAPKIGHVTPKPIDLLQNIILHSSNEGDIILDPTCGSGSTCVAAKELGRNFIGIEKEEKYCQIAEERLQNCGKV
jgi:site-specific DNA-methyltransferase (adenine-specific)